MGENISSNCTVNRDLRNSFLISSLYQKSLCSNIPNYYIDIQLIYIWKALNYYLLISNMYYIVDVNALFLQN